VRTVRILYPTNHNEKSKTSALIETTPSRIDWTFREDVRSNLRLLIKRNLRRYGYPPDKREKATRTVIEQAEVLSADWVATQ